MKLMYALWGEGLGERLRGEELRKELAGSGLLGCR